MKVTSIKTHKLTESDRDILAVLDKYLPDMKEGSVVAVTSKIVALCEGRVLPVEGTDKDKLIQEEADLYMPRQENAYNFFMTITRGMLAPSAGIDESNVKDVYVLWPKNATDSANRIREHLCKTRNLCHLGVVITDSVSRPLRWGVTGVGLAHSGFLALNDYRGTEDLFGRKLRVSQASVIDGISATAVLAMGEGSEQTPIAVLEDVPFVRFQDRNPTQEEIDALRIDIEKDLYGSILKRAPWQEGGHGKKEI